jgi:AcrR family transcriptional regulator
MKTKNRILEAALQLFNEEGIGNVSMRRIADAAGIQIGNLTYHFKNRDTLVESLLKQLMKELDEEIERTQKAEVNLKTLWNALLRVYQIQNRYRFLMLDLLHMFRQYPQLLQQFRENFELRREEFALALFFMQVNGTLQAEQQTGYYQLYLLPQLYCLSDFWLSEAELLYAGKPEDKPLYYARVTFSLLLPHLSEEGKKEYFDIMKEKA